MITRASDTNAASALASSIAAATSAGVAATEASAAAASAITAGLSETVSVFNAGLAQTYAADAGLEKVLTSALKDEVVDIYDHFDQRYLGPNTDDPLLDNFGAPLIEGAVYWNTNHKTLKFFDGIYWRDPVSDMLALMSSCGYKYGLTGLMSTLEARIKFVHDDLTQKLLYCCSSNAGSSGGTTPIVVLPLDRRAEDLLCKCICRTTPTGPAPLVFCLDRDAENLFLFGENCILVAATSNGLTGCLNRVAENLFLYGGV